MAKIGEQGHRNAAKKGLLGRKSGGALYATLGAWGMPPAATRTALGGRGGVPPCHRPLPRSDAPVGDGRFFGSRFILFLFFFLL